MNYIKFLSDKLEAMVQANQRTLASPKFILNFFFNQSAMLLIFNTSKLFFSTLTATFKYLALLNLEIQYTQIIS